MKTLSDLYVLYIFMCVCVLTGIWRRAVRPNIEVVEFQASVSDFSTPILCRLLLCICLLPSWYSNPSHSYHMSSSANLGVPRLRPSIFICHTRSFAHVGVSRLGLSVTTNHPVLPLLSGTNSYCVPISPPILLLLLDYRESVRVA